MDPAAYGINKVSHRIAYVVLTVGGTTHKTKDNHCATLDPLWDETFTFPVADPENDKLFTTFFFGGSQDAGAEDEAQPKQIGIPCEFSLNTLKKNKSTFKGMPVVGGKIDFMLRAIDFGEEEAAQAADDFDPFEMM